MLQDLVQQFKREVSQHPEIVMDNYELKEGIYIKFALDKTLQENIAEISDRSLIIHRKQDTAVANKELLQWFKTRDYYSSVLNDSMNKAVDLPAKKIHSTNALTFFMKVDLLIGDKKGFSTSQLLLHLQNFYQLLEQASEKLLNMYPINSKKELSKKQILQNRDQFFQERYSDVMQYIDSELRAAISRQAYNFWEVYLSEFLTFLESYKKEVPFSTYVKVFFEAEESVYQSEYLVYILPKIFNDNKFNELKNENIVGLPAYDISMNAKKPYLELKTMQTAVPIRVQLEDALATKDLYKWLESQGKFREHQIPYEGAFSLEKSKVQLPSRYHIRLDSGGSIEFFENVPFRMPDIIKFTYKNVLKITEEENGQRLIKRYSDVTKPGQLHGLIGSLFFAGRMKDSFLHADPDIKTNVFTAGMLSLFLMSRQAWYDFLYKGTNITIRPLIDKVTRQLIEEQIAKTAKGLYLKQIADAYNLRLSLLQYLDIERGYQVADYIESTVSALQHKLFAKEQVVCESDEEFYFLAGQLAYYLLIQSQTSKKTFGLCEPILQAKTGQQLKRRLDELFTVYNHAISMGSLRFKNAMSMIMGYTAEGNIKGVNRDMLLAGLLAQNMLLQKQE
ncbi:hypothetical protein [Aneurinibacillus uraniidurans]|uniref:hypothetical protein n=1 Tax=Aneurinibacillus uraniidurans TaxID=2966586 RepID=UPI00234BE7E5|nr:hypothetical protein [Aneurinibacillus sp. B1]WCN36623.1 hypothetical protein PO771_12150 [Aneurinibacillus sp. B1]